MKRLILLITLLLIPSYSYGQVCSPNSGSWTTTTTNAQLKICNSDGTAWLTITNQPIPSGLIALSLTSCPTGWVEETSLNGVTLVGTLAANGNVGTTGGSDTITPSGTNSVPTFIGTVNTLAVTAHTVVATKQGTSTGNVVTTATHTITGIPGGSVTAPTFTGNSFDNRSSFVRVIFCKKN
jgi:hypothetical protein